MYQHLFFDWDHTLWDFETNSRRALTQIFYDFELRRYGVLTPQHFIDTYLPINYAMWKDYREGKIDAPTVKIKRFQDTLKEFGVADQQLVQEVKAFYLEQLPLGGDLMPNVEEALIALQPHYQLHVVTNGFLEVTKKKIANSSIAHFFTTVLSAEEAGVLKPNPKVFHLAMEKAGASPQNSLFIGDNTIADVQGAQGVGMDQVYFNPEKESHNESPTYEIANFAELIPLLVL